MIQRLRTYRYTGYTQAGAITEGRLQAISLEDAIEMLWERGLTPLETREDGTQASAAWWRLELLSPRKPSRRDVASFTREFATLAQSDIPLDDVLRIVSEQSGTTRMQPVIASLLEAVLDGAHLSEAMSCGDAVLRSALPPSSSTASAASAPCGMVHSTCSPFVGKGSVFG